MKIETKFNIGDEVYFIRNNRINKGAVYGIGIYADCTMYSVKHLDDSGSDGLVESKIFATRRELVDNLLKDED